MAGEEVFDPLIVVGRWVVHVVTLAAAPMQRKPGWPRAKVRIVLHSNRLALLFAEYRRAQALDVISQ
jgi:hypothetical protein